MFGSWPIATKRPSAGELARLVGVEVAEPHALVWPFVAEHLVDDARRARTRSSRSRAARSSMICDARNSSRRWTSVTFVANFVRKIASSIAESPPPTTTTCLSRKKAPSQVAQDETPRPWSALLGLEPELPRARAGRDDHRLGAVLVVADPDAERALGEVDLRDVVGDELGAEALGLAAEVLHHLRAHDPVGVAGVVLDVARDHQLAAPLEALDHERLAGWRAPRRAPRCSRPGRRR